MEGSSCYSVEEEELEHRLWGELEVRHADVEVGAVVGMAVVGSLCRRISLSDGKLLLVLSGRRWPSCDGEAEDDGEDEGGRGGGKGRIGVQTNCKQMFLMQARDPHIAPSSNDKVVSILSFIQG